MEDAVERAAGIGDEQRSDFLFFHEAERFYGQLPGSDGSGMRVHGVSGGFAEGVGTFALEEAAQVAVADDAEEMASFNHGGHAQLFV